MSPKYDELRKTGLKSEFYAFDKGKTMFFGEKRKFPAKFPETAAPKMIDCSQ